jgi:hypothetical protein
MRGYTSPSCIIEIRWLFCGIPRAGPSGWPSLEARIRRAEGGAAAPRCALAGHIAGRGASRTGRRRGCSRKWKLFARAPSAVAMPRLVATARRLRVMPPPRLSWCTHCPSSAPSCSRGAFAFYFELINLAETNHRKRRRIALQPERTEAGRQRGSLRRHVL